MLPANETRDLAPPVGLTAGRHVASGADGYLAPFGLTALPRAPGREIAVLDVLQTIRDFDPDAAHGAWTFLRMANPGHEVEVANPQTGQPDAAARAYLDGLAARAWHLGGGGADALVDVLHLAFYSYGGAGLDVELRADLRDVVDLHPFGPSDIEFRWVQPCDPVTGQDDDTADPLLLMFPAKRLPGKDYAPLPAAQVFYQPFDPDLDDPYGRPPLLPSAAAVLLVTSLLNEIVRVIHVHGFGIRDIIIDPDLTRAMAPFEVQQDAGRLQSFMEDVRQQVRRMLEEFENSDSFVHFKNVTLAVAAPGGEGIATDGIMAELTRRVWTALHTPPVIMAATEGTQTQGTVQWQVYVKGIKAVQRRVKRLLENAYNLALRVHGSLATATLTFAEIRETDAMVAASVKTAEDQNAYNAFVWGLSDADEFGTVVVGHAPADLTRLPPTLREQFVLQMAQAQAQLASTGAPAAAPPAANQPGSDQGITAEEGAALDQAAAATGTNLRRRRTAPPENLGPAMETLGAGIIDEVRSALRHLDAWDLVDLLDARPAPVHTNGAQP